MKKFLLPLFLLFATNCWAGFPNTPVLDTFTRGNSATLGANWTGPAVGDPIHLSISSNTATPAGGQSGGDYWNVSKVNGSAFEVYLTMSTIPASDFFDVYAIDNPTQGSAIFNGWVVTITTPNTWVLSRLDAGNPTTLATYTQAFNANDSFGMKKFGTTITTWYKAAAGSWIQIGSYSDGTSYNPLYLGIEMDLNDMNGINFGGGTSSSGVGAQINGAKINHAKIN